MSQAATNEEEKCAEVHCADVGRCPKGDPFHEVGGHRVRDAVQVVFDQFGPERERHCRWWVTMEEPWRSLARELDVR